MERWRLYFESIVSVCRKWNQRWKSQWGTRSSSQIKKSGKVKESRNCAVIDYETYTFSKEEYITHLSVGILLFLSISYLFYESILISILFIPFSILYVEKQKQLKIEERKWKLNLEFREGLTALMGALNAGYSIENSFLASVGELKILYDKEEMIVKEFEGIAAGLKMNQNVESLLMDFAKRSHVEDIEMFAEVFSVCKRTGGDLIVIISASLENIEDKIEVKRHIKTLTAAKRMETKIMAVVPLGIIAYLKTFSGGLLEPLYGNLFGRLIMTILLVIYVTAYELSGRIVNIEI